MYRLVLLLFVVGALGQDEPYVYKNCPKTEKDVLNVHIVPHTHDDVGWLKTVDQYYYGSRNNIQKAGVQYILDSVVKELMADPRRKFVYVETAFFWKWWVRASPRVQSMVRQLVVQGRLQFLGAAWSMNDEAASHYQSTIDQFTWGLSKIRDTFGPRALPRVGWQIDPFGHSREFASLLSAMEFDGLFLGRIDYQDKQNRLREKHMEMIWRGDDDLGRTSDLFTGVLYNTYSPPPGFCFDVLCNDEPIIDDPNSPMYNVDEKVNTFLNISVNMSSAYATSNVLVTMGEDFQYQDAALWYTNLDKLITYSNLRAAKEGLNIKLFYSTPNCYLKAVKEADPVLPTKQDDFFPYASDPNAYWTGYFTSRPTTKYFERQGNNYLQMVKQLQVLADLDKHNMFVVNELKSAMGIMQHHDAITGTEKQHVTNDYERILNQAIEDATIIPQQAFNKYIQNNTNSAPVFDFNRCRLNESSCHVSEESTQFLVNVYNPLAWYTEEPIRIPVVSGDYEVYAPNGEIIVSQIVDIPVMVKKIPNRRSLATHELVFIAYLHPLSYKSYYVRAKSTRDANGGHTTLNDVRDNDSQVNSGVYGTKYKMADDFNTNVANFGDNNDESDDIAVLTDGKGGKANGLENSYVDFKEESLGMMADGPMIVERYDDGETFFENQHLKLKLDNARLKNIILKDGTQIKCSIDFSYYPGCVGNNEVFQNRSSGAYIFRPNATKPIQLNPIKRDTITGAVVKEIRTQYENALSVVKLYDRLNFIEHEWLIGPISIADNVGKEYIVKYTTDLTNNGEFFTDSNGRQLLKRKLNMRPQWNLTNYEPIAGNYYPVTNEIYIQSRGTKFAVLPDRSEGGTSLEEGSVELMLHRRLLHDDAFGVGEALNETVDGAGLVVRGKHRVLVTKDDERKYVINLHNEPIVFIADAKHVGLDQWMSMLKARSWLNTLPEGVHLLTLEPWHDKMLLRLENYLQKANSTVQVDLATIFKNIAVKAIRQTTLSANDAKDNHQKWVWRTEGGFVRSFNEDYGSFGPKVAAAETGDEMVDDGFKIMLRAKEIKTFIVKYDII